MGLSMAQRKAITKQMARRYADGFEGREDQDAR